MADSRPFSADFGQTDPLEGCTLPPVVPIKAAQVKKNLKDIFKCSTKARQSHAIKGTRF